MTTQWTIKWRVTSPSYRNAAKCKASPNFSNFPWIATGTCLESKKKKGLSKEDDDQKTLIIAGIMPLPDMSTLSGRVANQMMDHVLVSHCRTDMAYGQNRLDQHDLYHVKKDGDQGVGVEKEHGQHHEGVWRAKGNDLGNQDHALT